MSSSNVQLPGIGVFGTGVTVRCIVPILKSCGFKVEAIWGRTKEIAEECARDLDIKFHTNKVDQVLLHKDVDLVFINCPPLSQSPIAVKALGIGKHVICGIPAGPTQIESLRMVNGADYYPSLMSIMCNGLRFLPCFAKMKQAINDGYVGTVNVCEARVHCPTLIKSSYDWLCDENMGGGVLNMYGSSFIDIISFLIDKRCTKVQGVVKTFTKQTDKINGIREITSDDFCNFMLEFQDGCFATICINSHASNHYQQELYVCGSKGRLIVRGSDLFGQKLESLKEETIHRDAPDSLDHQKTGVMEQIIASIPVPHMKGLFKLIDSVKEAFRLVEEKHGFSNEPVKMAATFDDEHYVRAVIEGVRMSSRRHDWVKVELMTEEPHPSLMMTDNMKRNKNNY
ncbi:hypothetical protein HELRODRAFT_184878 [Helobdella robusta]|uniref:Gfo/Idh/MocA-like oxidoreductase N-terminal domain-containing protein n=1 Tax=Helobdella robusta TaxID=6412 RepID=T1FM43_HELRO|nr:hypothetical protein HELRODRAFT_184878 [Helobdella robusta]ESO13176.1 hypothetical protein HELRODRAFT_184878 [Helobdella robusta]